MDGIEGLWFLAGTLGPPGGGVGAAVEEREGGDGARPAGAGAL
jgi:hypothetical protein